MESWITLALAAGALTAGPLLALLPWRQARVHASIDGFVLVMVAGLCLVSLLPEAFEEIGAWALPLAAAGFFLPHLAESRLHHHHHGESAAILGLAAVGLLVHGALDGATLAVGQGFHGDAAEEGAAVGLAVVLHRLPVSLFLWWTARPKLGDRLTWLLLAGLAGATFLGFAVSEILAPWTHGAVGGVLHALLAGGLLHVVLDHHTADSPRRAHRFSSAVGATLGLLLFILVPKGPETEVMRASLATSLQLLLESALAIVLGFLGAGLLSLVPTRRLARLMTGSNAFTSALRGVIFGLPLPVCSCGVVPLYRSLNSKGVPPAAAMAFLVATPELGMDALIISVPLLGVRIAVIRVIAAVIVAMVAGLVAGWLTRGAQTELAPDSPLAAESSRSFGQAMRYGFVESVDDLGPWIVFGLLLAGALEPLLTPGIAAALPRMMEVPILAVVATPLYICASGATPVAAVLLAKGLSAGAVLAMLISGPASNVTTFGAVRAAHTLKHAILLVATIPIASILVGWIVNLIDPATVGTAPMIHEHQHGTRHFLFAGIFGLMIVASFFRQGPRGFLGKLGIGHDDRNGHDGHDHDGCDTPEEAGKQGAEASCCSPAQV